MTYKHRDIVIAYINGQQIQYEASPGYWSNLREFEPALGFSYCFREDFNYRIKPETKKYRVAQMKLNTMSVNDKGTAQGIEHNPLFVRWLTDWVEYEV